MAVTITATFPNPATVLVRVQAQDATWTTLDSLERTDPWGNRYRVRAAAGMSLAGGVVIVADNETPLGCPVTYIAVVSKAGSKEQGQATITVPAVDPGLCYLADANNPDLYLIPAVVEYGEVSRSSEVGVFEVLNRLDPVVTTGKIGAKEGSITLGSKSQNDTDALWALVNSTDVLLFRTSRRYGVGVVYMAVTNMTETRVTRLGIFPHRTFEVEFTMTGPPAGVGVASGFNTWQRVKDNNTTWQKVLDTRATWEEVLTSPYGTTTLLSVEEEGLPTTELHEAEAG